MKGWRDNGSAPSRVRGVSAQAFAEVAEEQRKLLDGESDGCKCAWCCGSYEEWLEHGKQESKWLKGGEMENMLGKVPSIHRPEDGRSCEKWI